MNQTRCNDDWHQPGLFLNLDPERTKKNQCVHEQHQRKTKTIISLRCCGILYTIALFTIKGIAFPMCNPSTSIIPHTRYCREAPCEAPPMSLSKRYFITHSVGTLSMTETSSDMKTAIKQSSSAFSELEITSNQIFPTSATSSSRTWTQRKTITQHPIDPFYSATTITYSLPENEGIRLQHNSSSKFINPLNNQLTKQQEAKDATSSIPQANPISKRNNSYNQPQTKNQEISSINNKNNFLQQQMGEIRQQRNDGSGGGPRRRRRRREKMKPMPVRGYDASAIEDYYDLRPFEVGWRLNSLGLPLLGTWMQ